MLFRMFLASLLALLAAPVLAQAGQRAERRPAPTFEQRVAAILDAGGTLEAVQGRIGRVERAMPLTADQRIAVDGVRTLVRGQAKDKGPSIAEAEAFAARYPGAPVSAILLAEAALANDQPQRSADALIIAAARAGPQVDLIRPATVSRLTDALDRASDKNRTANLARSLLNAGWSRGSAALRSYLAMAVIRDALKASRIEEARRLLPTVTNPGSLHAILIDNRLAALRPDVERLAGPRLERQWRDYLGRLRDQWLTRGDYLSASEYLAGLRQANHHHTLVDEFLSRFMRGYNCPTDFIARSVAGDLADSLVRLGRWAKAEDVMRRAGGIAIPVYAAMLLEKGDYSQAAMHFDRVLKSANAPKDRDGEIGLAWMRAARDCASYRSRSLKSPSSYDRKLLELSTRVWIALCLDRPDEARAMLIAALEDEEERFDALRWVQPVADPAVISPFRREMSAKARTLQGDPTLIEAASRHGVILDWPLTSSAPAEAEMATSRSGVPWRCGAEPDWSRSWAEEMPKVAPIITTPM